MSRNQTIKSWLRGVGFNQLLVSMVSIGILVIMLFTTLVSSNIIGRDLRARIEQEGIHLTETFVEGSRLGLLYESEDESKSAVDGIMAFPDVQGAAIYLNTPGADILYSRGSVPDIGNLPWPEQPTLQFQDNKVWIYSAPVYSGNANDWANPFTDPIAPELLGYVRIAQSKNVLHTMLNNIYWINLLVSLCGAGLLVLTLLVVTNRVTKPILSLARIMRRAEQGEKDLRANLEGPREIIEMESAFNTMMAVLHEREQELKSARDMALEAARIKGEFAANVSHELRTPMNGVLGMLELMKDLGLPAKQEEYLEIATSSAESLLALIDDILDFSKTDAGKVSLEASAFSLRDLLEEITTLLSIQAQRKNLQLAFLIESEVPEYIRGDTGRLRQVLINLIANGIKFTDWGEVRLEVAVEYHQGSNAKTHPLTLKFTIIDSGIGISETDQLHIFNAFSQADSSTTKRYGGTGLGLAIASQLVHLMGGDIGVSSEKGVGSEFWFTINLQHAPELNDNVALAPPTQKRVLVIDNNETNRRFAVQQLQNIGVVAEAVEQGAAALEKLRSEQGRQFGFLLIDENISGLRADDLTQLIANDKSLPNIHILLLVNRHNALTEQYQNPNIAGFLRKPLNREEISRTLKMLSATHTPLDMATNLPGKRNSTPSFIGARVLVVEDNRSNQKVAVGMLERLGCLSEIANNGREAVEMLLRSDFDIVLMDCHMPDMDGYETTAQIRVFSSEKSRIPIIAMTANVQQGEHDKCLAVGMDDFLAKPLKLANLRAALERWTESKAFALADSDRQAGTAPMVDKGSGNTPIDRGVLEELEENIGDAIKKMLDYTLTDLTHQLPRLEEAIINKKPAEWSEIAHSIKGMSMNIGARRLYSLCEELESRGKANSKDDVSDLLDDARLEVSLVCKALMRECIERGIYQANGSHGEEEDHFPVDDSQLASRVLVVDDDRSLRLAIRETIESTGHRVDEVANGEQALMYCERFMPDLILMDAVMPEMDGFTACEKILRMPGGENVTVVIITALNDETSISRAFAAGAMDYIAKPINFAVLQKRVVRLLQAKQAESHVRELAYNDTLTGLPNRKYFTDKLAEHISTPRLSSNLLAILFLDLDRFKLINDTFGHDSGDLLLKVVAERLVGCVRQGDMVSRFGGDEFVIMLNHIKSYSAIEGIAAKIQQALARPFVFLGKELRITTSIGIATFPDNGDDINILLKNADLAMYRAKRQGNRYEFFESRMEEESSRRLSLENDLRGAIERGEMQLYYQPQVDNESGDVIGAEALIRWQHPTSGFINPLEFIGLAEETGQIFELGEWVLETACAQLKRWHSEGHKQLRMAVNISGRQLDRGDLHTVIIDILNKLKLSADSLEVEITESSIMENAEDVIGSLENLKQMGVSVAVDDFGTGYSSLSYLRRFPIDLLKIDREFVRDVDTDKVDADIVSTIITLAQALGVKVLAEGVETEQQRAFLHAEGCHYLQGYLFGKPVPADEFADQFFRQHPFRPASTNKS